MARSKPDLKLVAPAPEPAPTTTARSTIARAAQARDKPERPYEVPSDRVPGLLLRVQPSGYRAFYAQLGRGKRVRIGPAGHFMLAQAEEAAKAIMRDPQAHATKRHEATTLGGWLDGPYRDHALAKLKGGKVTLGRIRSVWRPLLTKRLADIKAADVDKLRDKRLLSGVSPATVARDCNALSGLLAHWSHATGAQHPMRGLKALKVPDDQVTRYLTDPELVRLHKALAARDDRLRAERVSHNEWLLERGHDPMPDLGAFGDHITPMTLLALATGMRRGEIFSATWGDVDLEHRHITVRASNAKTTRTRVIRLNSEVVEVLSLLRRDAETRETAKPTDLLFPSPVTGQRIDNITKAWRAVCKAAGLSVGFHSTRHTFASRLVAKGVPLYDVQVLLGHSSPKLTMRYAKLQPHALGDAVEKLVGITA